MLFWGLSRLWAAPDPFAVKSQGPDTLGNPVPYIAIPPGAQGLIKTALTSSANAAASSNAATLNGAANLTTFITGFECTAGGSTAALDVNITITGTISGTLNYSFTFPVGATVGAVPLVVSFAEPIPASAVNTSIVVTLPSGGAGNTNAAVTAHGFRQ